MKINKDEYLLHLHDEKEKKAMKRVLDLVEITINRHSITYTDFLEPNLVEAAKSILNRFDQISYSIDGGFENAERNIISIYSWYYFYEEKDLPLKALELKGNIENLDHRDVLGSLLGLGIVREKIGDIGFFPDSIKLVVSTDISTFILYNLNKVKHENIKVQEIPLADLGEIQVAGIDKDLIVSSLRLDQLVAEAYNLSRSQAQKLVASGLVKVNFSTEEKGHKNLEEGDLVSVRKKGRFKIKKINGLTKKGRIKTTIFYPTRDV
ncbi:MAG: YlmH/Sll1252 family protein [Bacillota bacterium]|nr:YlmH/Sll1252 family protein [Bacillota bacterium]